jgi:hypothetical protein
MTGNVLFGQTKQKSTDLIRMDAPGHGFDQGKA